MINAFVSKESFDRINEILDIITYLLENPTPQEYDYITTPESGYSTLRIFKAPYNQQGSVLVI